MTRHPEVSEAQAHVSLRVLMSTQTKGGEELTATQQMEWPATLRQNRFLKRTQAQDRLGLSTRPLERTPPSSDDCRMLPFDPKSKATKQWWSMREEQRFDGAQRKRKRYNHGRDSNINAFSPPTPHHTHRQLRNTVHVGHEPQRHRGSERVSKVRSCAGVLTHSVGTNKECSFPSART